MKGLAYRRSWMRTLPAVASLVPVSLVALSASAPAGGEEAGLVSVLSWEHDWGTSGLRSPRLSRRMNPFGKDVRNVEVL